MSVAVPTQTRLYCTPEPRLRKGRANRIRDAVKLAGLNVFQVVSSFLHDACRENRKNGVGEKNKI